MAENEKVTISCIIPACNEAARIEAVLAVAAGHPLLAEVIVVDDCSGDNTAGLAAQSPGVTVIRLRENHGKSGAVAEGIAAASGNHLLLLDADLVGLTAADISALVAPVQQQCADVTISLRSNSPLPWRAIGLDYISGERVFARALVADRLDEIRQLAHFGLEVWLNERWIAGQLRMQVVAWPGVISPLKGVKMGWWRGLLADVTMLRDIFHTVSLYGALQQIWALQKRRR